MASKKVRVSLEFKTYDETFKEIVDEEGFTYVDMKHVKPAKKKEEQK